VQAPGTCSNAVVPHRLGKKLSWWNTTVDAQVWPRIELLGEQQAVIKPLGRLFQGIRGRLRVDDFLAMGEWR